MTPSPSVLAIGGKAASLAALAAIPGVRVPPWFAVPATALADALDAAGIGAAVDAALARLAAIPRDRVTARDTDAAAAELAGLLGALALPAAARADAEANLRRLGGGPVAVRSSGVDEDGAERSFAGQHDTLLFVDDAGLADAIVACWRSAFGARALFYRARLGLLGRPELAVVVQKMIDGHVSGVLFTADAATGDRGTMIATSTWGLGEGVVSGRMACDTFTITRGDPPAIAARDVVDKAQAVRRAPGGGTAEVDVAEPDRARPSLDDDALLALARLGAAIEGAYGHPVDLEWTIDATGPWLLQARPITALPPPPAGRRRLWDNSNIIESYSGVTTPLTYSFARRAYGMVYRQAFALLGVPRREIEANGAVFEQMIGLLDGRVYYNLESWYRALQLLPGYKFNAEFMEQMMGVREGASFGRAAAPRSAARRWLVDLPELVASLGVLATRFARAQRLVDGFFDEFGQRHAGFWERDLEGLSVDKLVDVYLDAERTIMGRWQAPIVNDILAMIFFGALRKTLASWGIAAADASLHNDLLCGEGGLESTEPTRDLLALAEELRRDAPLAAMLRASAPADARAQVAANPAWGWLRTRLALHVDRYGDRCIDELKLEQATLRDDDTFLYATLKGYLAAPPVTVAELEARERAIRAEAEATVLAALGRDPVKRRVFRFLVEGARRHVKNRENLRFARTRAFGLVRRIVVAIGRRLVEARRLDDVADVFYLEVGELIAFARGTATTTDLRGLAAVRKAEYARYRAAPPPEERFWTTGATYLDPVLVRARAATTAELAGEGDVLQGVAAAPGRVTAKARLVHDPRGVELAGDVLIANRTDPGWVPLFPSAAAVVVERGSVLSHSAIVAREFGIPCVVGLRDALARIPDGATVVVDGGAGTLTILGR